MAGRQLHLVNDLRWPFERALPNSLAGSPPGGSASAEPLRTRRGCRLTRPPGDKVAGLSERRPVNGAQTMLRKLPGLKGRLRTEPGLILGRRNGRLQAK